MDVRRFGTILVVCLGLLYGCGPRDTDRPEKEATVLTKPSSEIAASTAGLMTGEQDRFNPRSPMESIRKTSLTPFGRLRVIPPIRTPDSEAAQQAFNQNEFSDLKVAIQAVEPITTPSYPFDFENNMPVLKALYDHHHLDDITRNASELTILVGLMKYTYHFLEGGTVPDGDLWWQDGPSAETITRFREERGIGGTSEQYSALFCQLALSSGFTARIVGMHTIGDDGEVLSHSVCEVYLRNFARWAVFDPYSRATYYTRDGVPLNALELRNIMFDNLYRVIHPVIGIGDLTVVRDVREDLLPRYRYIYYWRMNDILSRSHSGGLTWQALWEYHLVWEDEMAPVSQGAFDRVEQFSNTADTAHPLEGVRFVTHDRGDFYWDIYQMQVHINRTSENDITYYLDTLTPNFSHFLAISTETGQETVVTNNVYTQGMITTELNFRVYDKFDHIKSSATIIYQ